MSKLIRVALVMDSIQSLSLYKDTSMMMAETMQNRGWCVDYLYHETLIIDQGKAFAKAQRLTVEEGASSYQLAKETSISLVDYDLIFMRQDPPFNKRYIFNVMVLQVAESQGAVVINACSTLLGYNEKIFATYFTDITPPTLVSRSTSDLWQRYQQEQNVVIKPLDGMGGKGIFHIKPNDDNATSIIETVTEDGSQLAIMQNYLADVINGDKRIFLIDGEPVDYALARIPKEHEARANLVAGGTGVAKPLTKRDRHIANIVGNQVRGSGLYFVGLDIIGDYLTEINVTSPTGARELLQQTDLNAIDLLLDKIVLTVL